MEKALQFIQENNEVAFATVGNDNKPKIRVFQIMKQEGTTLYFATAPHKEVYTQLKECPFIEILSRSGDISVRIEGEVFFDVKDAVCKEIYDTNPVLGRLYAKYTDLVYFSLPIKAMDYFDLKPTPPTFNHFDL